MSSKLFIGLALLSALSLASCDSPPDGAQSNAPAVEDDGTTTVQVEVPDALMPAVEALQNPQETWDNLRQQAGTMSEQAKADAVVAARNTAETAARALGQTEVQIEEAGNVAETNARQALGL